MDGLSEHHHLAVDSPDALYQSGRKLQHTGRARYTEVGMGIRCLRSQRVPWSRPPNFSRYCDLVSNTQSLRDSYRGDDRGNAFNASVYDLHEIVGNDRFDWTLHFPWRLGTRSPELHSAADLRHVGLAVRSEP